MTFSPTTTPDGQRFQEGTSVIVKDALADRRCCKLPCEGTVMYSHRQLHSDGDIDLYVIDLVDYGITGWFHSNQISIQG